MKCPVCRESMLVVEYHSIELDYCSNCRGTWFDKGELELLLRSMELDETPGLMERIAKQPEPPSNENKRRCPICRRRMQKRFIGSDPQLLIDYCSKQHGLWFDAGELNCLVKSTGAGKTALDDSEKELLVFLSEAFEAEDNCN